MDSDELQDRWSSDYFKVINESYLLPLLFLSSRACLKKTESQTLLCFGLREYLTLSSTFNDTPITNR